MLSQPFLTSPGQFVIRIRPSPRRNAVLEGLRKLGPLNELCPERDLWTFASLENPPIKFRECLNEYAPPVDVMPVLLDSNNSPRYPVGNIMVRFKRAPSEAELSDWAKRFGLQVLGRNKYAPAQAAFGLNGESSLQECLEKIEAQGDVLAAWPETLSSFQRHTSPG